jgi:hypothetical protein
VLWDLWGGWCRAGARDEGGRRKREKTARKHFRDREQSSCMHGCGVAEGALTHFGTGAGFERELHAWRHLCGDGDVNVAVARMDFRARPIVRGNE